MKANCDKCLHKNVCTHYKAKQTDNYEYMGCEFDFGSCKDFADADLNIKLPCKVGDAIITLDNNKEPCIVWRSKNE